VSSGSIVGFRQHPRLRGVDEAVGLVDRPDDGGGGGVEVSIGERSVDAPGQVGNRAAQARSLS